MSENSWKYAMLPEKTRLEMIKNGDNDVYETEKARNKYFTDMRKNFGIDTSDLDNWGILMNQAKASGENPYKTTPITNVPKYYGGRKNKVISEFNAYMNTLKSQLAVKKDEALQSAIEASNTLREFLANNGLSQSGTIAKKRTAAISGELKSKLDAVNDEYDDKAAGAAAKAKAKISSFK